MTQPSLLLIDDEPVLAEFLATVASEARPRCRPSQATDGDFRAQFVEQLPDMVALDLGMPGMDGVELLRFLSDQQISRPQS